MSEMEKYYQLIKSASESYKIFIKGGSNRPRKSFLEGALPGPAVTIETAYLADSDSVEPLDSVIRSEYETLFGQDLADVRIHRGAYAEAITRSSGAWAVTIGSDIYFSHGAYNPQTDEGKALLAHELAHAVSALNGENLVYLEDTEAAETAGSLAEEMASKVRPHAAREAYLGTPQDADRAEADLIAVGDSSTADTGNPFRQSLSEFASSRGTKTVSVYLRNGETLTLTKEAFDRCMEEVVKRVKDYVRDEAAITKERGYAAMAGVFGRGGV